MMARRSIRLAVQAGCWLVLPLWAWADDVPAPASAVPHRAEEDVVYGQKDGLGLTLDVLTPTENAKQLGIVLVSSGSWHSKKSNLIGEEISRREKEHWVQGLLQGGYTLFITRHGSAPRYFVPEMVEDIRRAVRFVRHNAARFGIDSGHLGITSGSSGGHLALMVGLSGDDGRADDPDPVARESCRTQAVVAWFAPTDLINFGGPAGYKQIALVRKTLFEEMFGKVTDLEQQLRSVSPIELVTSDDPPLLMIHGDRDRTVPLQQSQVLLDRYQREGLPVELVVHAGGGHSEWPGILDDYPAVWRWFDRHLGRLESVEAAPAVAP